jgi:hypothetical protein
MLALVLSASFSVAFTEGWPGGRRVGTTRSPHAFLSIAFQSNISHF